MIHAKQIEMPEFLWETVEIKGLKRSINEHNRMYILCESRRPIRILCSLEGLDNTSFTEVIRNVLVRGPPIGDELVHFA